MQRTIHPVTATLALRSVRTIRSTTWWFLAGTLSTLLFIVIVSAYWAPLETLYLRETAAPQLEKEFGFTAREIQLDPAYPDLAFVITKVDPNGAFARAGVRPGDQPWDYHGRNELTFYETVQAARGRTVTLHVVRVGDEFPKSVAIPLSLQ
jgi:hypothetical protein